MNSLIESPYDDFEQFLDLEAKEYFDLDNTMERVLPILMRVAAPKDKDINLDEHRSNIMSLLHDMTQTFGTDVFSDDLEELLIYLSGDCPDRGMLAFLSRIVVYLRMPICGDAAQLHHFLSRYSVALTPLWVGPRLKIGDDVSPAKPAANNPPGTSDASHANDPVIGVIDDGIGFLNQAFCNHGLTRIDAIWLMKRPDRASHGYEIARCLTGAQNIDGLIDQVRRGEKLESEIYDALNRSLYAHDTYHATSRVVTHGTHMLGLASARSTSLPNGIRDLLAVELPPFSVRDMTGHYLAFFAYLGVRLMLRRMIQAHKRPNHPPRPLIINFSIGMLAGPKNNTGAFPREFLSEVDSYKTATQGNVTGVFSFGNAGKNRQVATIDLSQGISASLDWRIIPDDRTANFLELRGPSDLEVSIEYIADCDGPSHFVRPATGHFQDIKKKGRLAARIYGNWSMISAVDRITATSSDWCFGGADMVHKPDGLIVALRPTHDHLHPISDAPGLWRVHLRSAKAGTVICQIQSGDTPSGYLNHGRQSFFEDPQPTDVDPVTPQGSYSAMIPKSPDHFSVTALRWTQSDASDHRMPDAAQGGFFEISAADAAIVVEDHFRAGGLNGLGTLSGTTARIGGTSAAAARYTAYLATRCHT
jgi:hypothetical protein